MTQENEGQENEGRQNQGQDVQTRQPPQRNVFLARNAKPVTVEGVVNIGGHGTIELPDEAAQRRGFYLKPEDLTLLLNQFPGIYKPAFVYSKGQTVANPELLAALAEAQKQEGETPKDADDAEDAGDKKEGQQ